ncbi:cilia- and flagella-associated protein 337-like [Watersipora subatra]|uniref:cilia- and flagella-associated protein 337-like n=1 Tax=Watersipora subatra TaxID=2589382 RepID=UPI00355B5684
MNIADFRKIMEMFSEDDEFLDFTREQFVEAMVTIGATGSRGEFGQMFDRIDVTKQGVVNWDKFASHMLLEFYEKDDKVKSTLVPHWTELKVLSTSVHKDIVQGVTYLKTNNRYFAISKEGSITLWTPELKLSRSLKTATESCRTKDLWVTDFVALPPPINKVALAFTSKEIAVYDMSSKIDFNTQYKIIELHDTPLCMDFWLNSSNSNDAILAWGDVRGSVSAINFSSATIALFERPAAPAGGKQDPCLTVKLADIQSGMYKNAKFVKHSGHSEWVRQVKYCHSLECFLSCATTNTDSLVIGWLEQNSSTMRTSKFQISQGINAFDFHPSLNLIATAGVNHQVSLWNPYVVSKANGLLRGHMAAVVQVQYIINRNQLLSFSKDKVLRIWDVGLQVCIQRLAGMFPKTGDVQSIMYFDELRNKLFITFNYQITVMAMKAENKDRVFTHDKPVTAAIYNSTYNQVVSVDQGGTMAFWVLDTGQRVKSNSDIHPDAEVTALAQDASGTMLYTGATDGTIKVWDFNGHCYHMLHASDTPGDIGHIIPMKRILIAVGWTRFVTVFRDGSFKDFHVHPSDWKGGQEHRDDITTASFSAPHTLATAGYDGEIILWHTGSEQVSRKLVERAKPLKRGTSLTRQNTRGSVASRHASTSAMRKALPSQGSQTNAEDGMEASYTITTIEFLEERKDMKEIGADLISCGGNGWVRFWNSHSCKLIGEFTAHPHAGSIIMAVDPTNKFLVTADVDGQMRSWIIEDYNMIAQDNGKPNTVPPSMICHWTPHGDSVTTLAMCQRMEKTLIISASSDACVVLSDIKGKVLGTFGQEQHWRIEPFIAGIDDDFTNTNASDEEDFVREETVIIKKDDDWKPDDRATTDPVNYKVDSWSTSLLGQRYQEERKQKRERKQPSNIPNLPYLHWERTGAPPAGPYNALVTRDLDNVDQLKKPDFMSNPHKFFGEKIDDVVSTSNKLPALSEALKHAFDEKSLFPKFILDYENELKKGQQPAANNPSKRGSLAPTRQTSGRRTISKQAQKTTKTSSSVRTTLVE